MLHFRPMLAAGFNKEKNAWMLDSEDYTVETKLNGDRVLMFVWKEGAQFFTRTLSSVDDLPVEKTGWLPHLNHLKTGMPCILDGEIITSGRSDHTTVAKLFGCAQEKSLERQKQYGWLQYVVFDCLLWDGVDIRGLPLHERKEMLQQAMEYLLPQDVFSKPKGEGLRIRKSYLRVVRSGTGMPFVREIWRAGGEGVIIKALSSKYVSDGRLAGQWMKLKTELVVDLVIMGYKEAKEESTKSDGTVSATKYKGLVGSILLGAYDKGKLFEVTYSSGIDDKTRRLVSVNRKKFMNTVVRVKAQSVMLNQQGKYSLQNPRIIGMRDDKKATQCTMDAMLKERGL